MVNDEEILPSYWSGSYFTLAPGESTLVSVSCSEVLVAGKKPVIMVGGWNVKDVTLATGR
jgi:hypothetical protein